MSPYTTVINDLLHKLLFRSDTLFLVLGSCRRENVSKGCVQFSYYLVHLLDWLFVALCYIYHYVCPVVLLINTCNVIKVHFYYISVLLSW